MHLGVVGVGKVITQRGLKIICWVAAMATKTGVLTASSSSSADRLVQVIRRCVDVMSLRDWQLASTRCALSFRSSDVFTFTAPF